jgi:hypothetical protein
MKLFSKYLLGISFALLMIFVAGKGAYAQTIGWSAEMHTGIMLHLDDDEKSLRLLDLDSGLSGLMAINGKFVNKYENAGINFQLRAGMGKAGDGTPWFGTTVPNGFFAFEYAYGWYKAFADILTIYGGRVDVGFNRTAGGIDPDLDGSGILIEVNPIPALDLSFGAYTSTNITNTDIKHARYVGTASYDIQNLFKVIGSFRNHVGFGSDPDQEYKDQMLVVGFQVTALKDIGFNHLAIDAEFDNLGDFSNLGIIKTGQLIHYNYPGSPFWISGKFKQWFHLSVTDTAHYTPDLFFHLNFLYSYFGNILPRLAVTYISGSNGFGNNWLRGDDENGMYFGDHIKGNSVLQIRPEVEFRFDPEGSSAINAGYAIWIDTSEHPYDPNDKLDHSIFIQMTLRM